MQLIKYEAAGFGRGVHVGLNKLAGQVLGLYAGVGKRGYALVWCKPTCRGKH